MSQSQPQPGQLEHWPDGRPEQAELPDLILNLLRHSPVILIVAFQRWFNPGAVAGAVR